MKTRNFSCARNSYKKVVTLSVSGRCDFPSGEHADGSICTHFAHVSVPRHNISLVKVWGFVLWAGQAQSEERETYAVVSQLAEPISVWVVAESSTPALPWCRAGYLQPDPFSHSHIPLITRETCSGWTTGRVLPARAGKGTLLECSSNKP